VERDPTEEPEGLVYFADPKDRRCEEAGMRYHGADRCQRFNGNVNASTMGPAALVF